MPQCVKCNMFFHPDYMLLVDEQQKSQQCVWCYLDKEEVTLEDENGNGKRVGKNEAAQKYAEFIQRTLQKPNVQRIIYNYEQGK